MEVITTAAEMRKRCRATQRDGKTLGFVPTMGALHQGHLSLFRAAADRCDVVAGSIFVNPTQFGPNEDLATYPRTLEKDRTMLEGEGVHLLFAPNVEEMYPTGASTFVNVDDLSERLDGQSRPGHFRGVTTIVSKLFHVAEPDIAFFGQKDAAQVAIIKKMVRDLDFAAEIAVCPIVREPDGLAMSSRNAYLCGRERQSALTLYRSLERVRELFHNGEQIASKLVEAARKVFLEEPAVRVDYIEIVDWASLSPVDRALPGTMVAVAAFVGKTRLIDNMVL